MPKNLKITLTFLFKDYDMQRSRSVKLQFEHYNVFFVFLLKLISDVGSGLFTFLPDMMTSMQA